MNSAATATAGTFGVANTGLAIATFETVTLTAAGSALAGAASGFAVGFVASGGNLESGIKGAASGALLGAINGIYNNSLSLERIAMKSFGNGIAAEIQGGKFKDGFLKGALNSGASYIYRAFVGYEVTAAPGENQSGDNPARHVYEPEPDSGRLPLSKRGMNIVGLNKEFDGSWLDPLKQGGSFTQMLNMVPGVNAIAGLDDFWQNNLNKYYLLPVTIPGAVLITVPALLDKSPVYSSTHSFGKR